MKLGEKPSLQTVYGSIKMVPVGKEDGGGGFLWSSYLHKGESRHPKPPCHTVPFPSWRRSEEYSVSGVKKKEGFSTHVLPSSDETHNRNPISGVERPKSQS